MSVLSKCEIDMLLDNITRSGYLKDVRGVRGVEGDNACEVGSVIMSLAMCCHKYGLASSSYMYWCDVDGDGKFVPDIVMSAAPPVEIVRAGDDAMLAYDVVHQLHMRYMETRLDIFGLEHFKISGWNTLHRKRSGVVRISSRVDEWRNTQLSKMSLPFAVKDNREFRSSCDVYKVFENRYAHHFGMLNEYYKHLGSKRVPVWFIIECDDIVFLDNHHVSVPIFVTPRGSEIVRRIGCPSGLLYFGPGGIWAFSHKAVMGVDCVKDAIALPYGGEYEKYGGSWFLKQPGYLKKVL